MRRCSTILAGFASLLAQAATAQAQSDASQRRPDHHRRCRLRRHRQLRRARHQDAEHRQPGEERHAADRFLRGAELLADAGGAHQRPLSAAVPDRGSARRGSRSGRQSRGCVRPDARCRSCSRTTATAPALIGKWHLGYKREFSPNAHGFDYFFGFKSGLIDYYQHTDQTGEHDLFENDEPTHVDGYSTDLFTERSVKFIEENAGRPFFLEVAYNAAHWPFQVPDHPSVAPDNARFVQPQDDPTSTRQDYVAILERADHGVGQILAALDRRGLSRNTLVIFTQRQRRRVAVAQRAAVSSQADGLGRRHPRAGDLQMAGADSRRQDVVAGRHRDGSHRDDSCRDQLAGAGRGAARRDRTCCRC